MLRTLAVALVAPLLGVAACASEAEVVALDPIAAIRAVPDATAAAGSGRFELTVALDAPAGTFAITSTGGFAGDQMTMEMDLGGALSGLVGGESGGGSGGEIGGVPDGLDEPMQVVVDGASAYVRLPMLAGIVGTTDWLSVTAADMDSLGSLGLGAGVSDPSQLLQTLRGVAGAVEEIGREDVRGVSTTHYRATVDTSRALEAVTPDRRAALEQQLTTFDASLGELPVDLWVDADGLARRMVVDAGSMATGALGGATTARLTLELFDYGEDVTVVVPDPADVTPLADVLGAFGGVR